MAFVAALDKFCKKYNCKTIFNATPDDAALSKDMQGLGYVVTEGSMATIDGAKAGGFDMCLCRKGYLATCGKAVPDALTALVRVVKPQGIMYVDREPDLATEEDLHVQMHEADLECMKKINFAGEDDFDVIIATKADHVDIQGGSENLYLHMQDIYRRVWDPKGRLCWSYFKNDAMTLIVGGKYHCDRMAERATFTKDSKVLDVGCGNGNQIFQVAERYGCEIVGCDPTECLIEKANKQHKELYPHIKAEFHAKTLQDCKFSEGEFTHIWSNNAIGYVPVQYRAEFWKEMYRVLKPGGILCFDDILMPCATYENGKHAGHEKLSDESLNNFFRRLHFEVPLHSVETYDKMLPELGFEKVESEDLAIHQRKTYVIVRERANALGYYMLSRQYNGSVIANEAGECGWGRFVYRKPL